MILEELFRESKEDFLDSLPSLPAGPDFISTRKIGLKMPETLGFKIPNITKALLKSSTKIEVKPSDIETLQGYLLRSKVKELLKSTQEIPEVTLLRFKKKLYLNDGNHRLAAAVLRGDSMIKAHVIDIGDDGKPVKT